LYGTESRFFPSDAYLLISLPVAAVIALWQADLIIRADFRRNAAAPMLKRVVRSLLCPVLAAVIVIMTVLALCVGAPGLMNEIAGKPEARVLTVLNKHESTAAPTSKQCQYDVTFEELRQFGHAIKPVCISEETYRAVKPEMKLLVRGRTSWVGFTLVP
jgi:hypothetical protein